MSKSYASTISFSAALWFMNGENKARFPAVNNQIMLFMMGKPGAIL
jgi:hypothetical protein